MSTMRKAEKAYYDQEYSMRETLKRIAGFATEHKTVLAIFMLLVLADSLISIFLPLIIRNGLNLLSTTPINFQKVRTIAWIFFIGNILEWISFYLQTKYLWKLTAGAISTVRLKLFDKLY